MKKYFAKIIIFVSLTFYMSCDGYLDTESRSSFVEETVFNSIDFAKKAVLGIYAKMVDSSLWGQALGFFFAYDNDIEFCSGNDDGARRNCARYTDRKSTRLNSSH